MNRISKIMRKFFYLALLLAGSFSGLKAKEGVLTFVENRHQWDEKIRYRADLPGGAAFFTPEGFTYNYYSLDDIEKIHELKHEGKSNVENEKVDFHAYRVSFLGHNRDVKIGGNELQPFYHNYFLGNNPSKWAGNVPVFGGITYGNIYDGIDVKIYSAGPSLKYDFVVAPGADPSVIRLGFDGVKPTITRNGDLKIVTSVNTILEKAPYVYQMIGGKKVVVPSKYTLKDGVLGFEFPKGYNRALPLIIDPVLVFATYSGSTASTWGFSATYDASGHLYAGGEVFNVGWPVTTGAFQQTYGSGVDAGLNKYSPNGSSLVYSTYYGGNGMDLPNNMITTTAQELVVTGSTASGNLPVTAGCYDNTLGGGRDAYVAHFNAAGSALVGATYVGGSDEEAFNDWALSPNYGDPHRGDLYIDTAGNIIVAASTKSFDFPVTAGAIQSTYGGMQDGMVFKLDRNCTALLFSTFLGGTAEDACFALDWNANHEIVVVGGTRSNNFPVTAGSHLDTFQGQTDGFVAILNATGTTLLHSSFLGTDTFDHAFKVQVDRINNHVYVCGQSYGAYPISPGVYTNTGGNIFIQQLSGDLSTAMLSTIIGGNNGFSGIVPTAFLYDVCGNIYFCGFQAGPNLPLTNNAYQTTQGGFWLCVLDPGMTSLNYATYMGGFGDHVDGGTSRFDPQGVVYHSVCTGGGFTATSGSWSQNQQSSGWDVASFKFDFEATGVVAQAGLTGKDSVCLGAPFIFTNNSVSAMSYHWDFGDNSPLDTATAPSHTYQNPGTYTVTLYAHRPNSCIPEDTAYLTVHVVQAEMPVIDVKDTVLCEPGIITLTAPVTNYNGRMSFKWTPVNAITSSPDQQTITVNTNLSTSFTVTVTDSVGTVCKETAQGTINIIPRDVSIFQAFGDTAICPGDSVRIWAVGGDFYHWTPWHRITDTSAASVIVAPDESKIYYVTISDTMGCEATREVAVVVHPDPYVDAGEDETIKYGERIYLHGTGSVVYEWTPDYRIAPADSPNPMVDPLETTTYYVTGTSAEGCKAYDSVTVKVTNVIIPTVFSPNGDGRNDFFHLIPSFPGVRLLDISVYNRWGQRVFHGNQVGDKWDGSFEGQPCDMGTYFFTIIYAIGKKQYSEIGNVTIVR